MGRKLVLANLIILTGILVLAQQMVESWAEFQGTPTVLPLPARELELSPPSQEARPATLPQFLVIAEKNLFTESRGLEPSDGEDAAQRPPELAVEPKLVSVSSFGGTREAVLEIFEGRRSQNSERRAVKLGDTVQGYQVVEIQDSSLVLGWQSVRHVIPLEPPRSQPRQAARAGKSVNIITVGSAASAVETTTPEAAEEEARGIEVGVVSAQQGRAPGARGAQTGGGLRGGRGGLTGQRGSRGSGRNQTNSTRQGLPGTVGFGQPQPPPQNPPPR